MTKKQSERKEAWMRIPVLIVSGIIFGVWRYLIYVFAIINFIYTTIEGKRIKDLSELSEVWNSNVYYFLRYMSFNSNKRPFPFSKLEKNISKFK